MPAGGDVKRACRRSRQHDVARKAVRRGVGRQRRRLLENDLPVSPPTVPRRNAVEAERPAIQQDLARQVRVQDVSARLQLQFRPGVDADLPVLQGDLVQEDGLPGQGQRVPAQVKRRRAVWRRRVMGRDKPHARRVGEGRVGRQRQGAEKSVADLVGRRRLKADCAIPAHARAPDRNRMVRKERIGVLAARACRKVQQQRCPLLDRDRRGQRARHAQRRAKGIGVLDFQRPLANLDRTRRREVRRRHRQRQRPVAVLDDLLNIGAERLRMGDVARGRVERHHVLGIGPTDRRPSDRTQDERDQLTAASPAASRRTP